MLVWIGQMCGYFEPIKKKIELSVTGEVVMKRMEQMSDTELLRLLEQGAPALLADTDDEADDEN